MTCGVPKHHFMSYGIRPSAITMAGYLLGAVRRIAVGTTLAEQATLLDQLSGGRFHRPVCDVAHRQV